MKRLSLVACVLLFSACSSPSNSTPATASAPAPAKIPITTKSPEALAHYQKSVAFFENARPAEGLDELKQALALDPQFVSAKAFHGGGTPGPDGVKEMEEALAAAASLPEAERLLIEAAVAQRRGEQDKAASALRSVTELAPGDYQGFLQLGSELLGEQKYAEAQQAFKKATELNPSNGGAQNLLGYASLRQGDTAAAIAALEQYVRIQPQEANAQDSLGEALMGAGRFKDAEAAFQKAAEMAPQFWPAQQGIAYARFYAGDWAGGRAALMKGREVATRPIDKLTIDNDLAAAAAAQRDFAQALKLVDTMEKAPGLQLDDTAFVGTVRGLTQMEAGRSREALASLNAVVAAADGGKFTPGVASAVRPLALRVRAMIEAQMRDAAAAAKTSAALDADATAQPNNAQVQSMAHHGRAMLALAKGDAKGALAELGQCSVEDRICAWQRVTTAEKAGDKAAAATARQQALLIYGRDPVSLVVRSRLGTPAVTRPS
ncbi:MAG TPA: tetratricopeptide repeat protein [Vicinamibacterales bacterium]|nr:tetratricopeptide repeat protein [Vicinamibacterales bacterium]